MFNVGDKIVFGTDGVCTVEKVGPLEIDGVSKDKIYYTLIPLGKTGNGKIFAPVESKRVVMRAVVSLEEAKQLIGSMGSIARLKVADERKREETYKKVLQSCSLCETVSLIKEIWCRKQERQAQGKKLPAVDERYFVMAENSLYSELSLPLKLDKSQVKDYIVENAGLNMAI